MTKEDAGDILLRSDNFEICNNCRGEGGWWLHDEMSECGACQGYGGQYKSEYVEACVLLELQIHTRVSAFRRHQRAVDQMIAEAGTRMQTLIRGEKPFSIDVELPSFFPNWAKK